MRSGLRRPTPIRAGRHVSIRRATEKDHDDLTLLRADPEIDYFMGIDGSPGAWLWRHIPLGDQSAALTDLVICTLEGVTVGLVSLWDRSIPHRAAEVSIWVGADFRNRGYGTEGLRLALRYAFDDLELHKVYLRVLEYNYRARHSYEKCGFVTEGVLREEMQVGTTWHSLIYMGVLGQEFATADARLTDIAQDPRVPPAYL